MDNKTTRIVLTKDLITNEQYAIIMESGSVAWTLLSLKGVISNIINIRTFIAMGLSDGVTVSFLFLSFFDLSFLFMTCFGGFSMGLNIIEKKFNFRFQIEPYGLFLICGNIAILLNVANSLTTTFIAVARCMCVAKPLQFKNTFTRRRTIFFNVGIAMFSIIIYAPILANMGMVAKTDIRTNRTRPSLWMSKNREGIKTIVFLVVNTLLPLLTEVVIMVCVFVMATSLRAASRFRQASILTSEIEVSKNKTTTAAISDKISGKDQRVVRQVILISVVYIICNTIKIVISVVGFTEPQFRVTGMYGKLYLSIHCLEKYFEIGNASVNTFIYYSYNTKFRKTLSHLNCS